MMTGFVGLTRYTDRQIYISEKVSSSPSEAKSRLSRITFGMMRRLVMRGGEEEEEEEESGSKAELIWLTESNPFPVLNRVGVARNRRTTPTQRLPLKTRSC